MPGKGISPREMVEAFVAQITTLAGGPAGPWEVMPFHSNIATDYEPTTNAQAVILVAYAGSSYVGPARQTGLAVARLPSIAVMVGARNLESKMAGVAYSRDTAETLAQQLRGFRTGTLRWMPQRDGYIGTGENQVHWHQVIFGATEQALSGGR